MLRKKSLITKERELHDSLNIILQSYEKCPTNHKAEQELRKSVVKNLVRELSRKLYKSDKPKFSTQIEPNGDWQKLTCKWCHESHKPCSNNLGTCRDCDLPVRVWGVKK